MTPPVNTALTDFLRGARDAQTKAQTLRFAHILRSARTVPVLLDLVEAVLKVHDPQKTYALAQSHDGKVLCGHDPDSDDYEATHEESEDGDLLCLAKPRGSVCRHCCDCEDGCGGHPEWPCATVQALIDALEPAVQDPTPSPETVLTARSRTEANDGHA